MFSVYTAEYAVGPRNPVRLFSRNDVKLPGDLCEIVDDIWRPCAAPTAIGRHGDG